MAFSLNTNECIEQELLALDSVICCQRQTNFLVAFSCTDEYCIYSMLLALIFCILYVYCIAELRCANICRCRFVTGHFILICIWI